MLGDGVSREPWERGGRVQMTDTVQQMDPFSRRKEIIHPLGLDLPDLWAECLLLGGPRACTNLRLGARDRKLLHPDDDYVCVLRLSDGEFGILPRRWRGDQIVKVRRRSQLPACTKQRPPRRALVLNGGRPMNFTGLHRAFGRPVRPRRLSFFVRLDRPCGCRGFLNVFCSSSPRAYANMPAFYCGNNMMPPRPYDLFTFLLGTQASTEEDEVEEHVDAHLWTPEGASIDLRLRARCWHHVCLELDWEKERCALIVDSEGDGGGGGWVAGATEAAPFGPHARIPQAAQIEQMEGWRHLYAFTWLERALGPEGPSFRLGELWMEDETEAWDETDAQVGDGSAEHCQGEIQSLEEAESRFAFGEDEAEDDDASSEDGDEGGGE